MDGVDVTPVPSPDATVTTSVSVSTGRSESSAVNTARLLKQFAGDRHEMGVNELARRLEVGKSTAHRLVTALVAERLLERDAQTGLYRLGLTMYDLGSAVSVRQVLHSAAATSIDQLRQRTGDSVAVGMLNHRHVSYVVRLDSPQLIARYGMISSRAGAYVSASGKMLLAQLPEDELEELLHGWRLRRRASRTITDHAALRAELDRIRQRGFAVSIDEVADGAAGVAVPIRSATGRVIAAIALVGRTQHFSPASNKQRLAYLNESAADIASRLGFAPRITQEPPG